MPAHSRSQNGVALFFPFLPFLIAGHSRSQNIVTSFRLCQAIHAEVTLAALPPALCVLPFSMDGSKSGGDESEKALAIARVLKNASRERLVIANVREATRAEMPLWIASSLPLLATKTHREKDMPMR